MSDLPEPRANPDLFGQAAAEERLLAAVRSGRLPHAWLITGPRGVGKATLAFRFGRFILAGSIETAGESLALSSGHPVFRRVAAGAHGDLLTLERTVNADTGKLRGEIVVDEARSIAEFLHLSSAESGWRVVVIDSADDLNRAAANSVLKIIEEPPPRVLLLLVCHRPGTILPTIRSRCRTLTLPPLGREDLGRVLALARPDLSADERNLTVGLADGSAGRALELLDGGGAALQQSLLKLLAMLPLVDRPTLHAFADGISRPGTEDAARLASDLLLGFIARMVTQAVRSPGPRGDGEEALATSLLRAHGPGRWAEVREELRQLFERAGTLSLDRKQVWLTAFAALETAVA